MLPRVGLDLAGVCTFPRLAGWLGLSTQPIISGATSSAVWVAELEALEKENQLLKKIVADLELDKLILKESLDILKPRSEY